MNTLIEQRDIVDTLFKQTDANSSASNISANLSLLRKNLSTLQSDPANVQQLQIASSLLKTVSEDLNKQNQLINPELKKAIHIELKITLREITATHKLAKNGIELPKSIGQITAEGKDLKTQRRKNFVQRSVDKIRGTTDNVDAIKKPKKDNLNDVKVKLKVAEKNLTEVEKKPSYSLKK